MDIPPQGLMEESSEMLASLANIKDTQKVYTELTDIITTITGSFDGRAEHAVEILLKINNSIGIVFNGLLQTIEWLSQNSYEESQTVYAAINDIEIALLQIIQTLTLAASSSSLHTTEVLDVGVTIGMAIQDQASAISSMIEVISDITNVNGGTPESLGLAALLQTVLNLSENILGFSANILVSINGQVIPLHANMINFLTTASAEITEILQNSSINDATFSTNLSTALDDLDVNLVTIWSDKSVRMSNTLDDVVDGLSDTLNSMTTSLASIDATVNPLLIDSINTFQMEIISLTDTLEDITQALAWIPNSVTVAAINVVTSVDAIIVTLKDLLSAANNEHVADIIEGQLSLIADTLSTLIYAVSRQIDNAFTSVLSSENLLEDLQILSPIADNLVGQLQDVVGVSFIALDQALDSVVSAENLTWTPEDATALTDISNVLQYLAGRTQDTDVDVNLYPSIVALMDTSRNAASAADIVEYTVKSIMTLFE